MNTDKYIRTIGAPLKKERSENRFESTLLWLCAFMAVLTAVDTILTFLITCFTI